MKTPDDRPMTEALRNECRLFTRYLLGETPDTYVVDRYVELHVATLDDAIPPTGIDTVLLETSRAGLIGLTIADAYARVFRPRAVLRRKLVLAFAILENSSRYHARFTSGASLSYPAAFLRLMISIAGFAAAFIAGLLLIGPRALLAGRFSRTDSG